MLEDILLENDIHNLIADLKSISVEIEKKRDPETLAIALGRSSKKLADEFLIPDKTLALPLTKFRFLRLNEAGQVVMGMEEKAWSSICSYMDAKIPDQLLAVKKILIIDFCITGESLMGFAYYLKSYLKARNIDASISLFIICHEFGKVAQLLSRFPETQCAFYFLGAKSTLLDCYRKQLFKKVYPDFEYVVTSS